MTSGATTKKLLKGVPLVLLVVVAVWTLFAQRSEREAAPSQDEWSAAQQVIRDNWVEGDVIRIAPYWADSARVGMYEFEFNHAIELDEFDLYLYTRLWIISDLEHFEEVLSALPDGWQIETQWEPAQRTRVALVQIPPTDNVTFDVVTEIGSAAVTLGPAEQQRRCSRSRRGEIHCDRIDNFLHVKESLEETGDSLHRCLYLPAFPDPLTVSWSDVQLGSRLEGNYGNTMAAIRAERGSDVQFRIAIDGETVWEHTLGKWDREFVPVEIDTSAFQGQPRLVSLHLSAEDFFDRWTCLRLRSVQ